MGEDSLDDKFESEVKGKFPGPKEGEDNHLDIYFLRSGDFFKVNVTNKNYKNRVESKRLKGTDAFELSDKISIYLQKQKYSCTVDMKNLPKEYRK